MESTTTKVPLHTLRFMRFTSLNHLFVILYISAVFALLYHHSLKIFRSTSVPSFFISISMLISDLLLGFMWSTAQSFRMRPVLRRQFPENLQHVMERKNFPSLDIFVCTADPHKEPPMSVVNTVFSVMAYDYPTEKLSVYVSDDGGSQLTLFAFMEAAKFGRRWLPFCRKKKILDRCPDDYFRSNHDNCPDSENMKMMYETMRIKVETVVAKRKVDEEYIYSESEREAFSKWTQGSTRQHHPTVIQVLLEHGKDKDIAGHSMPNLIYVSRQKSRTIPHHFKAGALNALIRVSAVMTNAPIILMLDCDMHSNDPQTVDRILCYFCDPSIRDEFGFVQFPQHFNGLNRPDIYCGGLKRVYHINMLGMDGLAGPAFIGTGCCFQRRVFFGGPISFVVPENPHVDPHHAVDKPIKDPDVLELAHRVAGCNYENMTNWGSKMGFRYGSLAEDFNTSHRLHCEGWKSIFCNPIRPAFVGYAPIALHDVLSQTKRWSVGFLEVAFSKFSPLTFGLRSMSLLMGLAYVHYAFSPIWSIPITTYAFLPQLALLNGVSIFPEVSDPWFLLYAFLFLGAYGQDCLEFILAKDTLQRWWNDQRMWLVRGLSSYLFGLMEYLTKQLGIATHGFNVTIKAVDNEQSKRYYQGKFEFGVASPMFVPLAMASLINLVAFLAGLVHVFMGRNCGGLFVQMFVAGFGVLNCLPVYEAMIFRTDKGRMPTKTTIISTFLAWTLYRVASLTLKT